MEPKHLYIRKAIPSEGNTFDAARAVWSRKCSQGSRHKLRPTSRATPKNPHWLKDDFQYENEVLCGVTPITHQPNTCNMRLYTRHYTHETMKWEQRKGKHDVSMNAMRGPYSKLGCMKTLCEVDFPQSRQQLRAQSCFRAEPS